MVLTKDNDNVIIEDSNEGESLPPSIPSESHRDEESTSSASKKIKLWTPKIKPLQVIKEYTWLDASCDYPFCKLCLTKVTGGKFHLKRHASSEGHRKRAQAAKTTPLVETYMQKKSILTKKAELKLAAFICVHNLPFLLLDYLPDLQKNIFPDSEICRNVKLKRKKATQLVIGVLAPHFQKKLAKDLKSNVFSIIIDEMTDISVEKSLIVIVRYWINGSTKDRIFDLVKVEDGTSEALFTSITNMLNSHEIPYSNIIGFASDGASTMMGIIYTYKLVCVILYTCVHPMQQKNYRML